MRAGFNWQLHGLGKVERRALPGASRGFLMPGASPSPEGRGYFPRPWKSPFTLPASLWQNHSRPPRPGQPVSAGGGETILRSRPVSGGASERVRESLPVLDPASESFPRRLKSWEVASNRGGGRPRFPEVPSNAFGGRSHHGRRLGIVSMVGPALGGGSEPFPRSSKSCEVPWKTDLSVYHYQF